MPLAALTDSQLYLYLAIGGGGAAVLAVLLYFLPTSKVKVPAVALGVFAGLAAGLGLGVLLMVGFGYSWESSRPAPPPAAQGGPPPGFKLGPPNKNKGPKGPKGPTATDELKDLLAKLDILTGTPPKVTLSPEQKQAIVGKLDELVKKKDFDSVDAISVLDTLLTTLKDQRASLEAVGFRWPPQHLNSTPPPRPPDVPLGESPHLRAVRERLSK
jgi:hypothetical protein